jgi:plastocyanin
MKKLSGVMMSILLFLSLSCSKSNTNTGGGSTGTTGTTVTISISNFAFSPSTMSVVTGTTVVWKNNDNTSHTATSNDGSSFNSGTIPPGGSFSYTAAKVGTFAYHCSIHPTMTGTLTVTQN